jgi:uncharacterized protein YdhG (YjbR/CyaY superfamily)
MAKIPATIDEYLAALPPGQEAALQRLRAAIRAAAPGAVEGISYGVPTLKLDGRMLVSFGAAAKHCSFYPGAYPIAALAAELAAYSTSKGTVRFPAERPLPAGLVRKLMKARLEEHARKRPAGSRRSR